MSFGKGQGCGSGYGYERSRKCLRTSGENPVVHCVGESGELNIVWNFLCYGADVSSRWQG